MAKQKKEGRGKDLPTDMPSETQRMMIRDMHDFRITGVNAFDLSSYESKQFLNAHRTCSSPWSLMFEE